MPERGGMAVSDASGSSRVGADDRQVFAPLQEMVAEWVSLPLPLGRRRGMNRHAQTSAEKDTRTIMTHTETHDTAARVAALAAPVAPAQASAKNGASPKKGARQRQKTAAGGKAKSAPKRKPKVAKAATPRAESKGAQILALIGRSQAATMAEIQKTTGWLAQSVWGFLSTAAKKHSLQIEFTKTEGGDRVYQIKN